MQSQRLSGRLVTAVVIAGALAFALAACGRKSALDPPTGSTAPAPSTTSEAAPPPDWREPAKEEAVAPAGRNRGFVLDPLLN